MGRYTERGSRALLDATVEQWCADCLVGDSSLTQPDRANVWTLLNLQDLEQRFNGNALVGSEGGGTFNSKWKVQLETATADVRLLAAELLLVHFLFPSSVTPRGKVAVIHATLDGTGIAIDPQSVHIRALTQSIGNPGIGFNTRRDLQLGFLIDRTLAIKEMSRDDRRAVLADPWTLRDFAMEAPPQHQREMMHILLNLVHPEYFERIASSSHKREIAKAFTQLVDEGDDATERSLDEQLFRIRRKLETELMPAGNVDGSIDFYHPPLRDVWQSNPTGQGEGTTDVESLEWKKQLILYGPPGTSKTFSARVLAETLISRAALRSWGPRKYFANSALLKERLSTHVEWVQLHPGFGYAEFVRGLRLDGDETRYQPGLLPDVIERTLKQDLPEGLDDLPMVLVLDEINRTDLSAMLGEAFSLLERDKRGVEVALPGINRGEKNATLTMPENLYIIGTMNEIDQSVETLDFALRRRFLWRECPFERDAVLAIIEYRWTGGDVPRKFSYEDASDQLGTFADQAQALNNHISRLEELGPAYQIGHTYFADIVFFLGTWLTGRPRPQQNSYLWTPKGEPRPPLIDLWDRSLKPLLEQYLAGTDDRHTSLVSLRKTFLKP